MTKKHSLTRYSNTHWSRHSSAEATILNKHNCSAETSLLSLCGCQTYCMVVKLHIWPEKPRKQKQITKLLYNLWQEKYINYSLKRLNLKQSSVHICFTWKASCMITSTLHHIKICIHSKLCSAASLDPVQYVYFIYQAQFWHENRNWSACKAWSVSHFHCKKMAWITSNSRWDSTGKEQRGPKIVSLCIGPTLWVWF